MHICSTYRLKHFQASNGQALGSPVNTAVLAALVAPTDARSCVQEHADKEKIQQHPALFRSVDIVRECHKKMGNPVPPTNAEVLVSSMRRNGGKRRLVVSLLQVIDHVCLALVLTSSSRKPGFPSDAAHLAKI